MKLFFGNKNCKDLLSSDPSGSIKFNVGSTLNLHHDRDLGQESKTAGGAFADAAEFSRRSVTGVSKDRSISLIVVLGRRERGLTRNIRRSCRVAQGQFSASVAK